MKTPRAKSKKKSVNEGNTEEWLVSYADLMTLVACFFILLIAFAKFDPVGFARQTQEVANHFTREERRPAETPLKVMEQEITMHPELEKRTKVSVKDSELVITFSGSTLFAADEYLLSDDSIILLDTMIDIIRSQGPNFRILVEGHTDNRTPPKDGPLRSNWALSGARAASVIERFEYYGFDPNNLIAVGHADTKPLLPNTDDEGNSILANQMINRRVDIKVLRPIDESKMMSLGLGVYFDDAKK